MKKEFQPLVFFLNMYCKMQKGCSDNKKKNMRTENFGLWFAPNH